MDNFEKSTRITSSKDTGVTFFRLNNVRGAHIYVLEKSDENRVYVLQNGYNSTHELAQICEEKGLDYLLKLSNVLYPVTSEQLYEEAKEIQRVKKLRFSMYALMAFLFLLTLVICSVIFLSQARVVIVEGESMEPTYYSRQLVIAKFLREDSQLSYPRYPVCVLDIGAKDFVIKRLIGYPGDIVQLIDGDTYVNGYLIMKRQTECYDNGTFIVPEDSYLFLGDNRAKSFDARLWPGTYLSKDAIRLVITNSGLGEVAVDD